MTRGNLTAPLPLEISPFIVNTAETFTFPGRDHLLPNQHGPAADALPQVQWGGSMSTTNNQKKCHIFQYSLVQPLQILHGQPITYLPLSEMIIYCQMTFISAHWGDHLVLKLPLGRREQCSKTSSPINWTSLVFRAYKWSHHHYHWHCQCFLLKSWCSLRMTKWHQ